MRRDLYSGRKRVKWLEVEAGRNGWTVRVKGLDLTAKGEQLREKGYVKRMEWCEKRRRTSGHER